MSTVSAYQLKTGLQLGGLPNSSTKPRLGFCKRDWVKPVLNQRLPKPDMWGSEFVAPWSSHGLVDWLDSLTWDMGQPIHKPPVDLFWE